MSSPQAGRRRRTDIAAHPRRGAGRRGDRKKSGSPGKTGANQGLEQLEGAPGIADLAVDASRVLDQSRPADRLERGAIGHRDRSLVALRRGGLRSSCATARPGARRDRARRGGARESPGIGSPLTREDMAEGAEHRVRRGLLRPRQLVLAHAERLVEKVKGLVFQLSGRVAWRPRVGGGGPTAQTTVALRPTGSLALAAG
jgi:hypothetical protein